MVRRRRSRSGLHVRVKIEHEINRRCSVDVVLTVVVKRGLSMKMKLSFDQFISPKHFCSGAAYVFRTGR